MRSLRARSEHHREAIGSIEARPLPLVAAPKCVVAEAQTEPRPKGAVWRGYYEARPKE
jgi:hypothetical protein